MPRVSAPALVILLIALAGCATPEESTPPVNDTVKDDRTVPEPGIIRNTTDAPSVALTAERALAERVILVVIDGPRHDLAHDATGPLAPLYAHAAGNGTIVTRAVADGPARTVPGHAALLTARPQTIANDGTEPAEGPLVWDVLRDAHAWGPAEMRFLYQKEKLGVLAPAHVASEHVQGWPRDAAMVTALERALADPDARLVVAAFKHPDVTGHWPDWDAHEASLATIGRALTPVLRDAAGPGTLVIVTADHARECATPSEHGRAHSRALDACDAHVPLLAWGWHVREGARVDACVAQTDVGAFIAHAFGARFPQDAPGRAPAVLLDANASASARNAACPPAPALTRGP